MTHLNSTIPFGIMLLRSLAAPDPMLAMLEWLCDQLMEVEISAKLGAEKHDNLIHNVTKVPAVMNYANG